MYHRVCFICQIVCHISLKNHYKSIAMCVTLTNHNVPVVLSYLLGQANIPNLNSTLIKITLIMSHHSLIVVNPSKTVGVLKLVGFYVFVCVSVRVGVRCVFSFYVRSELSLHKKRISPTPVAMAASSLLMHCVFVGGYLG